MATPRPPINYAKLHPRAKAADFFPNEKLLPDEQINALKERLAGFHEDARYSKLQLKELRVNISRGGIIRLYNEATRQYELFAVYKGIKLGSGAFGKVKMIQNLETGEFKAMKVLTVPVSPDENKQKQRLQAEIDLTHEAEGLHRLGKGDKRVLTKKMAPGQEDKKKLCIVEELAPGKELYEILKEGKLSMEKRFDAAIKALMGIQELHDKNMIHRDIKVENMMYDVDTQKLTIIDLAFWCERGARYDRLCGTYGCIAPEIYRSSPYTPQSDVYALGRVIQDMFSIYGFGDGNVYGNLDKIGKAGLTSGEHEALIELANRMLHPNPPSRISLPDAINVLKEIYLKKFPNAIMPVMAPPPPVLEPIALHEPASAVLDKNILPESHYIIIANRIRKIGKKIGKREVFAHDIEKVLAYAKHDSSQASKGDADIIKELSLTYTYDLLNQYLLREITFRDLYKVVDALSEKLEKLPHYGIISSLTHSPSKSAQQLLETLADLRALHRASPVEEQVADAGIELTEAYSLARDQKLFLRQKMKSDSFLPNLTEDAVEAYANNRGSDFANSKTTTNEVKATCLAYANWLLEQLQYQKMTVSKVYELMDKLTIKVEGLPHLGFLSKHTQKTSPTAKLLRECVSSLKPLMPDTIKSLNDVYTELTAALEQSIDKNKMDACLKIRDCLDGYLKTNNVDCITQALKTIEESKRLPRIGGVMDKPRFPIEKVIQNIDEYLRKFEVDLKQQSKVGMQNK